MELETGSNRTQSLQRFKNKSIVSLPMTASNEMTTTSDGDQDFQGWSCDEITPNLCRLAVHEGSVQVRGIPIHYWHYTRHDAPSRAGGTPIVMIHGGPSIGHNYMLPLKQQACRGRDVYFYDTGGCGKSAIPDDMKNLPDWLTDVNYYKSEELPALIEHWGLTEFHFCGNSFGGMIAQLYALEFQESKQLASIVLSSSLSDTKLLFDSMWVPNVGAIGRLPPFMVERTQKLIKEGAYDSDEYAALVMDSSRESSIRTNPFPSCVLDSIKATNPAIVTTMFGPASDFVLGEGSLMAHWNITGELHKINVPTLITVGRYCPCFGPTTAALHENIPKSELVILERAGHFGMIDEPGPMNDAMADFFLRVEAAISNGIEFAPKSTAKSSSVFALPSGADWFHVSTTVVVLCIGLLLGRFCWGRTRTKRRAYTRV